MPDASMAYEIRETSANWLTFEKLIDKALKRDMMLTERSVR